MVYARANTVLLRLQRQGGLFITWSAACAEQGAGGVAQTEEMSAMRCYNAIRTTPLPCAGRRLQMSNSSIKVSPQKYMPFLMCCNNMSSQIRHSGLQTLIAQIVRTSRWYVASTNNQRCCIALKNQFDPKRCGVRRPILDMVGQGLLDSN